MIAFETDWGEGGETLELHPSFQVGLLQGSTTTVPNQCPFLQPMDHSPSSRRAQVTGRHGLRTLRTSSDLSLWLVLAPSFEPLLSSLIFEAVVLFPLPTYILFLHLLYPSFDQALSRIFVQYFCTTPLYPLNNHPVLPFPACVNSVSYHNPTLPTSSNKEESLLRRSPAPLCIYMYS